MLAVATISKVASGQSSRSASPTTKRIGRPSFVHETCSRGRADVEDLYHTEAAKRMKVSRQTFDRIVRRARMKVAEALVRGRALRVLAPAPNAARKA